VDWLKERGHEPIVFQTNRVNEEIEGEMLRRAYESKGLRKYRETVLRVRPFRQRYQQDIIDQGELEALFAELKADVILVDVQCDFFTALATRAQIPVVEFCTNYDARLDLSVPPPTSVRVPRFWNRWTHAFEWGWLAWSTYYKWRVLELGIPVPSLSEPTRSLTRAAGLRASPAWALWGGMGLPQITFWPNELDLPRAPRRALTNDTGLWPCEACGPLGEVSFPWERIDAKKPLVYVAFGSQTARYPKLAEFLVRFLAAAAARPAVQFVLAAASHAAAVEAKAASHVVVVALAPQLDLLSKASLFVTHGGAGSVKEGVAAGVPMLVAPLGFDQPGAGARLAFHGLGEIVDHREVSVEALGARMDRMLADPDYARRVRAMRDRISARHRPEQTYAFVEQFIGARA
jgi:UDP:flavonoid glycosyltransferase YjiC (YdhE family)